MDCHSSTTPACTDATGALPPLAIIGAGCLFPGSSDFAGFWGRVVGKHDAIRPVPPTHWRSEDYVDPDPKAPDRVYVARGGFLDPISFDPAAFGIPPANLEATDASQLLGLVVARQALEDCGYAIGEAGEGKKAIDRSRVSVILGVTGTLQLVIPLGARLGHPLWRKALEEAGVEQAVADEVVSRIADGYVGWQENSFPGLLGNVVAGRIANRFDLGGTNCVVDAACASSLSALHLAAMELATGRADMVLTGGVDAFNDIFMFTCFSKTPALSPSGNARPFDAAGDGTVLGEGLGMVVLKRLADAQRDGDRVYAVLRGVGTSSDGKGNAIYAPRKEGQIDALRRAYESSGVAPDTIELVEAHGTGTRVGDATEVSALAEVYSGSERPGPWCAVGSIKSQIGHTKAAAGVAGLLKATAALYHKVLPPTIKVESPLEVFSSPECPLYINAEKRPWLDSPGHPRRAAVSAFGFGGSNFHCVLEEADPAKPSIDWPGDVQLLAISAQDRQGLKRKLQEIPNDLPWPQLRLRAHESRRTWQHQAPCRIVLVLAREGLDLPRILSRAQSLLDRDEAKSLPSEGIFLGTGVAPGPLAVLFPGQGSQYVGMLRDVVCHFPQAFETFSLADRTCAAGHERRLVDLVFPPATFTPEGRAAQEDALRPTETTQPALGAVSLAAWRVLESFGIQGDFFGGHSYGELTALCAAGWCGEPDFFEASRARGQLLASASRSSEAGTMLAVKAGEAEIVAVLREEGIDLTLANKNAPRQTVLSGPIAAIERAQAAFAARQIGVTRLAVSAAFHSPLMRPAREPFQATLERIGYQHGRPVFANVTASPYPADPREVRRLLAEQLTGSVEWVRQVEAMHAAGARDFLEVGPGGRLTGLVESILSGREVNAFALDPTGGKRPGFFDLACTLAWLAARGHAVDLARWDPIEAPRAPAARNTMKVELTGANYVRPRPARPAVLKPTPAPASNGSPKGERTMKTVSRPSEPAPASPPATPVSAPQAVRPIPSAPGAVDRALEITRESLTALQKMQEHTAQLHRQFLEGQDSAHRTVQMLVEQQQRLLEASLGLPVSPRAMLTQAAPVPVPATLPTPVPAPAPSPVPPPRVEAKPAPRPAAPVEQPRPVPLPAAPAAGAPSDEAKVLLEVVAEKTGYPVEMLEMQMALDADLGIDSIKRVEILSALQERLPDAPTVKPEHLGTLHTLGDIVAFLGQSAHPARTQVAPTVNGTHTEVGSKAGQILLEVVAEKTGYPVEMLEMQMALDADLGIDSIKRVEILSALQERLPDAPTVKPEHLGTLHTLGDIVAFLGGPGSLPESAPAPSVKVEPVPAPAPALAEPHPPAAGARLQRWSVQAEPLRDPRAESEVRPGSLVWISDEDPALAAAVADRLERRGLRPLRVRLDALPSGNPEVLLLLAPAGNVTEDWVRSALFAVQKAGSTLRHGGVLLTVSRLDGAFGFSNAEPRREPIDGALAGLAKTAALEWPNLRGRALDVAPEMSLEEAATSIVSELFLQGPGEVGISPRGAVTLSRVEDTNSCQEVAVFSPGDVVVVSGGARGVTAAVAVALAEAYQPRLVLLGRSPQPGPEPDWLASLGDEPSIKREMARRTPGISPRELGDRAREALSAREIRQTLDRIEQAGAEAIYRAVDVRDGGQVGSALAEVRRQHGPIRGIVHGAGVLADARIEDKTPGQFDAVWKTKVDGLRALLSQAENDDLKCLVVFSSSTARFGRVGQVDYAMANEALNKLAWQQASRHRRCRVVSMNWGPWEGGMVTPALGRLFAREGVGLIPLEGGARLLLDEIQKRPGSPTEVVVLAAASTTDAHHATPRLPPSLPVAFERPLEVAGFPILADHVLDGKPVVPAALLLEWLAHAAMVQNPGLAFHGCDELRVLHGLILDTTGLTLRVGAGKATRRDGFFVAPTEVRSVRPDGREVLHARAEVLLATTLPSPPAPAPSPDVGNTPLDPAEVYRQGLLFHGPALQGLERIEGCTEAGIVAQIQPAPATTDWVRQPLRQNWLTDPLVVDGAFQLMVLWTQECRGAGSLPCHLGRYRQYRRVYPPEGARVLVTIRRATDQTASADMDFLDREGRLVARLEGYEAVIDRGLQRSFDRNVLTPA